MLGICCLCTESQLLRRGIYCNEKKKKSNKAEEKEDDGSRFSHLGEQNRYKVAVNFAVDMLRQ